MRRVERKNDLEPEETERDRVRREPLPLARAILWKPLPDSYHLLASMMRAPQEQAQLFVTQRAFLQVERHLRSAPDLELGGFLAGHLCLCPRTKKRYAVVNTVVPFADVSDEPLGSRVTAEAHTKVRSRLDAHGLALIGWYRNGNGLGLQLLPDDIETHLEYFDQPWQTTMLVVPDPSKSRGAFFTYDPRVGRGYCIPFYELFDEHAAESNRLNRTCVSWKTYVASTPVEPLAAGEREIVETVVVPMRSKPEPQPPEPIDEWWDAIKDPWVRLKDVAVSATRREDSPMPLMWGPPAAGAAPPPLQPLTPPSAPVEQRRSPNGTGAKSSHGPDAHATTAPRPPLAPPAPVRPEQTRPAPPFAGPARPAPTSSVRAEPATTRTAERERPAAPKAQMPPALAPSRAQPAARPTPPKPRPIPPATAAAMARASAPPAVALPPDFHDEAMRWQRRRRIGFAVAAASFLAVIVLSSLRSRPQTVAQAATTAGAIEEGAVAPVAPAVPVSENGHAPLPLASAVDSLSGALTYYRDIADDHRQGRVGCRVLDRAYALVGRARARVDSSRSQVAGQLSDADSIRVSMLGAEYTHVAQTYRRSGCES